MIFVEVLVAMMCEDPEEHKLIRRENINERGENKIDHSNKKFVSISLSLGEAQGAWKLHPSNFVARKYSLIAKSSTSFIIWKSEILHFICFWHLLTHLWAHLHPC